MVEQSISIIINIKRMNDQTTIPELVEYCIRETYSQSTISDKLLKQFIENNIEFHKGKGFDTVGELRKLILSYSVERMKSDKVYCELAIDDFYGLLHSVANLRIYYLADFVYDYFINQIFSIVDFDNEPECDIWESFWYSLGQVGDMSHINSSIGLFEKYLGKFSDTDSYFYFTYSYFSSLFQMNYRMLSEADYTDNLLVIDKLISQIPHSKKENLDRILGNRLSSCFSPYNIGDDEKRYGIYLTKYFRPMLLKM